MTDLDHTRQAFINSINRILNSWNSALNDANSRGYPTNRTDVIHAANETTSVEAAALIRSEAKEWLRDLDHHVTQTVRLANQAAMLWPPPAVAGTVRDGITVGARSNTVETCGLCKDPVSGSHADPIRRIDGNAFHKNCWITLSVTRITPGHKTS